MTTVAALYVATNGAYFGLPGVDPWDEKRDARLYAGPWPVVAHPPCSTWCQLARVNEARWGRKVGDDGGCFKAALEAVRAFGGVLEHPAESIAWKRFGLWRPERGLWLPSLLHYGWVTEVEQGRYGHAARKRTWLYVCRPHHIKVPPPDVDWGVSVPTAAISYMKNHRPPSLPRLTKKQAKATPLPFRDLLLSMARSVRAQEAA